MVTDLLSLQHWLLQFGAASGELWLTVEDFVEWLGNGQPPWAAYSALMSGRIITVDKQPGVRMVRVGKNLAAPYGKVFPEGEGVGGQGRLWNGASGGRI